jgi:hypothetical protein
MALITIMGRGTMAMGRDTMATIHRVTIGVPQATSIIIILTGGTGIGGTITGLIIRLSKTGQKDPASQEAGFFAIGHCFVA